MSASLLGTSRRSRLRRSQSPAMSSNFVPGQRSVDIVIMTSLRMNQLSQGVSDWYLGPYLGSMDQLDIATYAGFLSDDVVMLFNNAPVIEGKVAAVGMLSGYWKSFASIEHEPLNIYGSDTAFVLEAFNHYVRLDSKRVTTRAVAITDRATDGKVTSVRVYADVSPLFDAA